MRLALQGLLLRSEVESGTRFRHELRALKAFNAAVGRKGGFGVLR